MKNNVRSLREIGFAKADKIILSEVSRDGFSTSWILDDEGIYQQLRYALKMSGIFLDSREKGVWRKYTPYLQVADNTAGDTVYYYYLTDSNAYTADTKRKTPVAFGCVAIVPHSDGAVSKGYSYCSTLDNFSKAKARDIAYWRLLSSLDLHRDITIIPYNGNSSSSRFAFIYKAEYKTIPTQEERRLLGGE